MEYHCPRIVASSEKKKMKRKELNTCTYMQASIRHDEEHILPGETRPDVRSLDNIVYIFFFFFYNAAQPTIYDETYVYGL